MDYEIIKLGFMVINMLVTAAVFMFVRNDSRHKDARVSLQQLEKKIDQRMIKECDRVNKIESALAGTPSKADLIRIHSRLDDSHKDLKEIMLMMGDISGQIKQINRGK